jgi:hypothetical protein
MTVDGMSMLHPFALVRRPHSLQPLALPTSHRLCLHSFALARRFRSNWWPFQKASLITQLPLIADPYQSSKLSSFLLAHPSSLWMLTSRLSLSVHPSRRRHLSVALSSAAPFGSAVPSGILQRDPSWSSNPFGALSADLFSGTLGWTNQPPGFVSSSAFVIFSTYS